MKPLKVWNKLPKSKVDQEINWYANKGTKIDIFLIFFIAFNNKGKDIQWEKTKRKKPQPPQKNRNKIKQKKRGE